MQNTSLYQQLYNELRDFSGCDREKFAQFYEQLRFKTTMVEDPENADAQKYFLRLVSLLIMQLPQYYELAVELIEQDTFPEEYTTKLLAHLNDHCGPDSIHHIVIHLDNPQTLKDALDKMYDNFFNGKKRYQITHFLSDNVDFEIGDSLTDPGEGIFYRFEFRKPDGSLTSFENDREAEQKLFDELVAHEEWRPDVVEYIRLINAINYTLGSESDVRYPDQRIAFEAPITALLKVSAEYIPLLCDCYAVFDKWHDVSALEIAHGLLPKLHREADEMIYLYAAAYGRALANYELLDTFEDTIISKIEDPDFRRRFIELLAADDVAASIAISFERRNLRGEDLRDELDLKEWDELIEDSCLGKHLKHICSEEELEELEELYGDTIDEAIEDPENGVITILPPDLGEITGLELDDRGNVKKAVTPVASIIYNTDAASFWTFRDKNYLITCDEGWIRLIDFDERSQFTVRELTSDEHSVSHLLTTQNADDKSPVHFVTYCNGLIQGWHMAEGCDKFRIRANIDKLFLSADGSKLAFIIDEDDDYDELPITDGKAIDMEVKHEKEGTFICLDVASLTEISRWVFKGESYRDTLFTPDGNYLYTIGGEEHTTIEQWDVKSGELVKAFKGISEYGICHMRQTLDGKGLIADTKVYGLPEMNYTHSLETYEFGTPTVSTNGQVLAMKGDMADNEHSIAFADMNTGKHLGILHIEEDYHGGTNNFFSSCGKWFCSLLNDDLHIWDLKAILANTPYDEMKTFKIDFPSVGVKTMQGSFIHKIELAKGNFINKTHSLQFEMLEHGEFKASVSPAQCLEGRTKTYFSDVIPLRECNTLIPQPGTTMGVKLLPMAKGLQKFFDVKVIISFPERFDPEQGENISSVQWYQEISHQEPVFLGWQFNNEPEFKAGAWMIEVQRMEDSTCLFRKILTVEKPFKPIEYSVQKSFCGLYADEALPQNKISESPIIIAKPGITFGLQFKFKCENQEEPYAIIGEMEHPPFHDSITDKITTRTTRRFKLSDGQAIGFFRRFNNDNEVTEGKWVFRLKDPGLDNIIMEEELEIVSPDAVGEPEFEVIDSGLYTTCEQFTLFNNFPIAEKLDLASAEDTIQLSEKMIFGFKCRFKNLIGGKRLAAMVYHPPVKSFFGDETEEDFTFDLSGDQSHFIGWIMDSDKYLVEGDWTIKVWEDEIDEEETPLFEKSFTLTK